METFDILLTNTQELQPDALHDFKTGDCSNNYIKYIVLAAPGHYKMYPNVGVGMYSFVNAPANPAQIERAIRSQLENDVFKNPRIDMKGWPTIRIDKVQFDVVA